MSFCANLSTENVCVCTQHMQKTFNLTAESILRLRSTTCLIQTRSQIYDRVEGTNSHSHIIFLLFPNTSRLYYVYGADYTNYLLTRDIQITVAGQIRNLVQTPSRGEISFILHVALWLTLRQKVSQYFILQTKVLI